MEYNCEYVGSFVRLHNLPPTSLLLYLLSSTLDVLLTVCVARSPSLLHLVFFYSQPSFLYVLFSPSSSLFHPCILDPTLEASISHYFLLPALVPPLQREKKNLVNNNPGFEDVFIRMSEALSVISALRMGSLTTCDEHRKSLYLIMIMKLTPKRKY